MEPEPDGSDNTLLLNSVLDIQAGVQRLLDHFEDDDEEEVSEEDS
jgi:hypothetical protein